MIIVDVSIYSLKILNNYKNYEISGFDIIFLVKKNQLIFCNLQKHGLQLIECLGNLNIHPHSVKIYNNEICQIVFNKCVVKCYAKLGYATAADTLTPEEYLGELNKFLNDFIQTALPNPKIISLASIAMLFLKKTTEGSSTPFIKISYELCEKLKNNLFGGRCELICPGKHVGDVYEFDFPSMYGNIMLGEFPSICLEFKPCSQKMDAQGFYQIVCLQNDAFFPNLQIKTAAGAFFVNGIFETTVYSEELDFFIESGGVVLKYISFAEVCNFQPKFAKPISTLLNLKNKKCIFAKPLMNTMYGRLAFTTPKTTSKLLTDIDENELLRDPNLIKYTKKNSKYLVEYKKLNNYSPVENDMVSACIITARARIILLKLMKQLLTNNFKILYVDTDSIFIQGGAACDLNILNDRV